MEHLEQIEDRLLILLHLVALRVSSWLYIRQIALREQPLNKLNRKVPRVNLWLVDGRRLIKLLLHLLLIGPSQIQDRLRFIQHRIRPAILIQVLLHSVHSFEHGVPHILVIGLHDVQFLQIILYLKY